MLSFGIKKGWNMRFSRKVDNQKQQFYTRKGVKLLFFQLVYFYLTIMLFCFKFLQSLNGIFFAA